MLIPHEQHRESPPGTHSWRGRFYARYSKRRLLLSDLLLANVLIDPFQDQVGKLKVVLVQHHHVTIAVDAQVRRPNHLSIAARSIDLSDERIAIVEAG